MPSNARRVIFLLFFLSGACGLMYEVVWTRMMTFVFGISVYAVTTVLCSFMAGLALGSLFFGRLADRSSRLLLIYGLLEIGIGLFALAFPAIMKGLEPVFIHIYQSFYGKYYLFSFIRFLIIFAVLLAPTIMMGGTFPLLSRCFVRGEKSLGQDLGFLYAINTTGAVAGTFVVGFITLAYLGISKTIDLAAATNIAIGAAAILLGRGVRIPAAGDPVTGGENMTESQPKAAVPHQEAVTPRENAATPSTIALVLVAIGASGFASLGLQVLWSRVLVFYLHNSTYAFSAMLTVFLLGLALGSWIFGAVITRIRRPIAFFASLELGIALWCVLSLFLLGRLPGVIRYLSALIPFNNWYEVVIIILAQAMLILFVPTLLMGMTLPLAARLVTPSLTGLGRKVGMVYAVNTLGTVLGSFVVGFILIPLLGIRNSFIILAAINAFIAAALFMGSRDTPPPVRFFAAATCVLFVAISALGVPRDIIFRRFTKAFGDLLFYKEEVTDTIMVSDRGQGWEGRTLIFADGRGTAGHWTRMEDRYYGHLPMLLHDNPKDVLVICFGAGNTMGAITRHKAPERIDCVELSRGVTEAAHYFETNNNVLDDPRVHMHFEDGRNFLLGTDQKFDIIHLDPPELHTAGVVNLYTEEFYELCKAHLKPGGIMSHWFNSTKITDEEQRIVVGTFGKVFPHGTVWQGPGLYSWNLIATDHPLRVPLQAVSERIKEPAVAANLKEFNLDDPLRFFSYLLMKEETVAAYTHGARTITDDLTIIDYTNPKSIHSGFGFVNILSAAKDIEAFLPTDPYISKMKEFEGGGLRNLIKLTEATDSVTDIIDWSGISPAQQKEDEAQLREHIEDRKLVMQKYETPTR